KAVDDVMLKANEVLNNPEAIKEEVEAVVTALTKAMSGLEIKPNNPSVGTNTSVKPGDITTNAIKTGDNTSVFTPIVIMALSISGYYFSKKKRYWN
ncbi:LPXTG cell wall anchor domain-containing protein, partial [Thomasclavelia cocleata]